MKKPKPKAKPIRPIDLRNARIDGHNEGYRMGLKHARGEYEPREEIRPHINRWIGALRNAGVGDHAAAVIVLTDLQQHAVVGVSVQVLHRVCEELGRLGYGK